MSLYADYVKERRGFDTLETESAFVTYECAGENCYISDIYVSRDHRSQGSAKKLLLQLGAIIRARGCVRVFGSVDPTAKNGDEGLRLMLSAGMKLTSVSNGLIFFSLELDSWEEQQQR